MFIKLIKISEINDLVKTASLCSEDVLVKQNTFCVDAKSLLGLYLIDWTKPAELVVSEKDCPQFVRFRYNPNTDIGE